MSIVCSRCFKRRWHHVCFYLISLTMVMSLLIGYQLHHYEPVVSQNDVDKQQLFQRFMGNETDEDVMKRVSMGNKGYHLMKVNFTCDEGVTVLKKTSVNDDYCDCKDGLDEPATSACVDNKFHCLNDEKDIYSSYVNDGICDCCDGSDEWDTTQPPSNAFHIPRNPIVKYAPCKDTCET